MKINTVLMDRVERSLDLQGNAFSLFQTATLLEAKVRERTHALKQALGDLENTNRQLEELNRELEQRVATRTEHLRRSLAEKETLLRELHHRVKNNLQTVCTLLIIKLRQFRDPSLKQAFIDTLARITAISLVHESLYSHDDSTQIDFSTYLRQLAEGLAQTYGTGDRIRLKFGNDPVYLDLARAIPIGLIAAEAVANAMKHAFPEGRSGTITVNIRKTAAGQELTISDDGVGVGIGTRSGEQGAGMGLIQALAGQVAGTLSWQRDSGTSMTISFA